ncbi:MAG: dUTP diphosphatase [Clostridia bacterium]|nr:dUTP diphosphatase [Clostridia bacterium]MBN2882148.1 dUTP diphosphatase [Clostridia bacterium]
MREKIKVYIEKCRDTAKIPEYSNPGDAGMDIYAAEECMIKPGETILVPTGLKVAIPDGFEIQVRPRSGISLRTKLRVSNAPGTIDSGYRDEIRIIVSNASQPESAATIRTLEKDNGGDGTYRISRGDRIAQMVLARVPMIDFIETRSVGSIGDNRGGGFGSTGHK